MKALPNPFTDLLFFELEKVNRAKDYEIQLLYPDGRLVPSYPLSTNRLQIDTHKLAAGVYLYVIINKLNGQIGSIGRITKIH